MRRLRDLFRPADRLRYLAWRARGSAAGILEVALRDGRRLAMRPEPTTDLETACEIYLYDAYRLPEAVPDGPAGVVVDLGANVGYSVVYWATAYPAARVLAFEPHPAHLELVYRHVVANGLTDRVQVVGAAAAPGDGMAYLAGQENESFITDGPGPGRLPIRLRDVFRELEIAASGPIDLLKIDIEGGEYALLGDERFSRLDVRRLVLEWHNTPQYPDGRAWCESRLRGLGYATAPGALDYGRAGLTWAWRSAAQGAS